MVATTAPRLAELRRVLKPTGACTCTATPPPPITSSSRWRRRSVLAASVTRSSGNAVSAHSDTKQGRRQHGDGTTDVLLFYNQGGDELDSGLRGLHALRLRTYVGELSTGSSSPRRAADTQQVDITGPGGAAKGNPQYEVMDVTRYWRFSKETMDGLIREGRIIQSKPGAVPRYKRYFDEMPGVPLQDVWNDIRPIGAQAAERLGYPTRSPKPC